MRTVAAGVMLCLLLIFGATGAGQQVRPEPTPEPAPTPVKDEDNRVEVIDLSNLENRVKELHKLGVTVQAKDLIVAGDGKVILVTEEYFTEE